MSLKIFKSLGLKGSYLDLCRSIRKIPFPITVPIFGSVTTMAEILNIHDNYAVGELRNPHVEAELGRIANPVVVDCGINVGITVRWWLHLNPSCRVFGLDMFQEAHDFTRARLGETAPNYTGITAALSEVDGEKLTLCFNDPLDGTNRIDRLASGMQQRQVDTGRIDTLLAPHGLRHIDLLKMDIEGYAGKALRGATRTLSITQNVILEKHSDEELAESEEILVSQGFRLTYFQARNLWFIKVNPH